VSTQTVTTAADLLEMAGRLGPCELVRGEVVTVSPSGPSRRLIPARLVIQLGRWAEELRRGRVFTGEVGLIVERDPDTARGADAA